MGATILSSRTLLWIVLLAGATPAATQAASDHLKCFKVKDPQAKAVYVADVDGLVAQTGCTIKVPAALACVPTQKTNVVPAPPGGGGTDPATAFGCYKLKCPKGVVPPTMQLADQFGTRTVTPSATKMVCAPVAGTTSTCTEAFRGSLDEALQLLTRRLDDSGNLEPASACGSANDLCCPGGTPTSPCGPLEIDLKSASVVDVTGAARLDIRYGMALRTASPLPVTIPLVGQCGIAIDTSAGTSPTIDVLVPANLNFDHTRMTTVGDVTINGLADQDVALVGGIGCQLASLGIGFFQGVLTDMLSDLFRSQFETNLCRYCDGTIAACPP